MSSTRAITIGSRLDDLKSTLRRHRETLAGLLAEVDEALVDVELLAAPIAALEVDAEKAAESSDHAHLAQYGEHGAIVLRVAEEHRVPLRQLLGPGTCHLARAHTARIAAARALLAAGATKPAAARVLRLTTEAVKGILRRAAEREAA